MSSREFKIVKRAQRSEQINPSQSQPTIKNIDSIKTRGQLEIQTAQPASTFVSRRELNQTSLVDAKDLNQLPVRANNNFDRVEDINELRIFRYEYNPNDKVALNSRINMKGISSVGKKGNQRYKSLEQQNIFQRRYEASESPIKRNGRPLVNGTRNNFNMKKWAYAPSQDINKIITLQRWWRYILKNIIRMSRHSDTSKSNSSKNRSKSSQYPKNVDFKCLMKAGENITEKVFPGKNDKLIVETRKVEVFKINKPIQEKQIMVESKVPYSESLNEKQQYSQSIREVKYTDKYSILNRNKRKNGLSLSQPKKIGEFRVGSVEKKRYADSSSDSRFGNLKKAGENITEKIFPGQNNTLINERRVVEVYKIEKPHKEEELRVSSKETYSEDYKDIRKEGEKLTENIYPGRDSNLISGETKVEAYKLSESNLKDGRIDSREKRRIIDNLKDTDINIKKRGEQIIEKTFPGKDNTLINEVRKVEVFKKPRITKANDKYINETEQYDESIKKPREAFYDGIEKKGENITEKIFPGENNKLILETRKVEVFKNKRSKTRERLAIDTKESKRYRDAIDEYSDESYDIKESGKYGTDIKKRTKSTNILERQRISVRDGKKRKFPKFIEKDGITKAFIKEKMAEIWMDEVRKVSENQFSIVNRGQGRNISIGTRSLSSDKKEGYSNDNANDIASLLNIIKQKDIELNNFVNQLKSQVEQKHKTSDKYDSHTTGKIGLFGNKSTGTNDYESKIRQLLSIIKDKDNYVNQLINKLSNNNGIGDYDIRNRIKNAKESTSSTNKNLFDTCTGTGKKFSELDFDKIKEHWNDIVKECPINTIFINDIKDEEEKFENEIEARDSVEIQGLEKEPLIRQLIDALLVVGFEKNENEYEKVQELEILRSERPENIISQEDSIEIIGLEKSPLQRQRINQLIISETTPENIYQRTQELEILRTKSIIKKDENEMVANDSIEIHGLEKEGLTTQLIDSLFIVGFIHEENKVETTNEIEIRRAQKEENIIELRDSVEIIGLEKVPLQKQGINQFIVYAFDKDENQIENTQEIQILRAKREENIIELRDSVQILGLEKEAIQKQGINQLIIYAFDKDENKIENTEQIEILRIEKPTNEIEASVSVELNGVEKQPLVKQLINELFLYETKEENECQRTEEFELFSIPKPENIIELKDNVEIFGFEKEPFKCQLINQLIIVDEDKPENEYQNVAELTILKTKKVENQIEATHSIKITGLENKN